MRTNTDIPDRLVQDVPLPEPQLAARRQPPKAERAETLAQARSWENTKARYLKAGLCHACAAQAAWGHQIGFGYRSPRPWHEPDRIIRPPCERCAPVIASFPGTAGSSWRKLPQGAAGTGAQRPFEPPGSSSASSGKQGRFSGLTQALGTHGRSICQCPLCFELFSGETTFVWHRIARKTRPRRDPGELPLGECRDPASKGMWLVNGLWSTSQRGATGT